MLKYFSMFSGIGGFELGIQNAYEVRTKAERDADTAQSLSDDSLDLLQERGFSPTCVGYSEIDKYAIKVYERQFNGNTSNQPADATSEQTEPDTDMLQVRQRKTVPEVPRSIRRNGDINKDGSSVLPTDNGRIRTIYNGSRGHTNYGDATKINAAELPDFDLLVGGFPCQAFSVAGKRAGFNDTRGTLFFDIARILAEKRPRHLVLENVKGLLSHDQGKTFQTILGVLSDLGYRVEWQVLNSKNFGVPQNRERIFIVGHLRDECGSKVFPIRQGNGGYIQTHENQQREWQGFRSGSVSATIHSRTGSTARGQQLVADPRIRRLTPLECERLQGFPDDWTKEGVKDVKRPNNTNNTSSNNDSSNDSTLEPISDTQRYKMCGNGVTVNVVEAVMTSLMEEQL